MNRYLRFVLRWRRRFAERFHATHGWEVAGGLAFETLLAIVPLATVTVILFRHFPAFQELGEALREFLVANLLPEAYAAIVAQYAESFSQNAAQLTALGVGGLILAAVLLLTTIENVFNRVWGVERGRGWVRRLTLYWFFLTAGPILIGGSIVAARTLAQEATVLAIEAAHLDVEATASFTESALAFAVPLFLLWCFFAFLYYAVPHHPVRWRTAAASALGVSLVLLLLQKAFNAFASAIPTYTLVYGAFAALVLFLLWLYALWLVILAGAIAGAAFEEASTELVGMPRFAGNEALAATAILELLWQAQNQGGTVGEERLRWATRLPPHETEALLAQMRALGWIERSDAGDWLAAIAPTALTPQEVLARFALDTTAWRHHASTPLAAALGEELQAACAPLATPFAARWPSATGSATSCRRVPPSQALPPSFTPELPRSAMESAGLTAASGQAFALEHGHAHSSHLPPTALERPNPAPPL